MKKSLISISGVLWLLTVSSLIYARGGGGCIECGSLILTPSGNVNIEQLKSGDKVISLFGSSLVESRVEAAYSVDPDEYFELNLEGHVLRLTSEHPVEISPGVFRMAGFLKTGDKIYIQEKNLIRDVLIQSVKRVPAITSAYNLLVSPCGTYFANGIVVHNKGCFLPETLIRKEDGSESPISSIRPNDRLLAFKAGGELVSATVQRVLTHDVNEYCVVTTAKNVVHVTAEHPFYVGNGTFRTLEALKVDDSIFVFDGKGLSPQRIESIKVVKAKARVYNLQTDKPNTFFADGIAVHNKGGGCFPAGVLISTPSGQIPIEKIKAGDLVTAIKEKGEQVLAKVQETHTTRDYVITVSTASKSLRTTTEHPICLYPGGFCIAGDLKSDDRVMLWLENKIISAEVAGQPSIMSAEQEEVYNLTVDWPHTFIADGFVVHNKGGGFGGGYHGGGSRGGSGNDDLFILVVYGIIVVVIIVKSLQKRKDENLDFVFSRSAIEKKSGKTLKLLEFLSRQDATVNPDTLRQLAQTTFLKLQECWQARDYESMKPLMMPDIYKNHCLQLQEMVRNHEINVISDLHIDCIDMVNVRYTLKENQREFTSLITATARDYYIDDRSREYLRGDSTAEQFQEFWTFQYFNKAWLLREIEQTRESDVLKDDNFFEQFTDTGVKQLYGQYASQEGRPGPWLEKGAQTKEVRIERMLNFLVQTDKIWDRQFMLETTRRTFLEVLAAWESGNEAEIPAKDLFPEVTEHLRQSIMKNKKEGIMLEFRNLCIRKVELVLVRNYTDNTKDEFVARLRAHAQKIVQRNSRITHEDEDVTLFEQYLTFGRLDNQWKLKEIMSTKAGQSALSQENFDQDSSPQQVQWYYQHNRAI
jgi:predicted lipid-binding transport protein (Tim44 family)/sortase (surface protein transpeptidase)